DPLAKLARAVAICRIVLKQVPIFFHCSAAASGINYDFVGTLPAKCIDVLPGQAPRHLNLAGMSVKRAAADLVGADHNFATIPLKNPLGRAIRVREQALHHTTAEQCYSNGILGLTEWPSCLSLMTSGACNYMPASSR